MFEKIKGSFSFTKRFKISALISCLLCATGLVGIILLPFGITLFNFDLDFVGGVNMEYELGTAVTAEIQKTIEDIVSDVAGVSANVVTSGNSGTAVAIKTVEIGTALRDEIFNRVSEEFGAENVSLISSEYVSASVGNDLKNAALTAAGLAAALILVYITIRFELRSGIAAVICLIHDLLVMLSAFIIFRIPMNMTFIAAALTIIGYSINATIVVFDRVRENNKKAGSGGNFPEIVDKSIWETMRRSIGTTVTTLLPVIFILILGVTSIRVFAFPLLVGIIAGGYSSVFIAGPLWNAFKGKKAQAVGE